MRDNGTWRSLVSLKQTAAAADLRGAGYKIETCEGLAGVYEEGMQHVLRQMARTQLNYEYEHTGQGYERSETQSDKVEQLFAELQKLLPEKFIDKLSELQSQVGYLQLEGMDAGYVAGFLAGYRFLKELQPE